EDRWRRPGKGYGLSATTNYKGSDLLYVFSTSTPFDSLRSYDKFGAYAVLEHKGDFTAASLAVAKKYAIDFKAQEQKAIRDAVREATAEDENQEHEHKEIEGSDYIEFAPVFLDGEDPPREYLVPELIAEQVIALFHGEPRARKSWAALDIAIAIATGTPAFGMERFRVKTALPVLYSSQEDSRYDVRIRAKALLRGRGIYEWPATLGFSVFKGIDLDNVEWRERLIRDIPRCGFRYFCLDPVRRYSVNADKGPAEVRLITASIKKIVIATRATAGLVHHDVKPPANGKDER